MIELRNVSFSYKNNKIIFNNISTNFEYGKFYALVGESGAGKTTFLSLLAGMDESYKGDILFDGDEIRKIGTTKYRRDNISFITQKLNLFPHLNAIDNIRIAVNACGLKSNLEEVSKVLAEYGINKEKAIRKVSTLSGGEQQRVALVTAICRKSRIILADEPTENLDGANVEIVGSSLQRMAESGRCVIMATHNLHLLNVCDVVYRINTESKVIEKIFDQESWYQV